MLRGARDLKVRMNLTEKTYAILMPDTIYYDINELTDISEKEFGITPVQYYRELDFHRLRRRTDYDGFRDFLGRNHLLWGEESIQLINVSNRDIDMMFDLLSRIEIGFKPAPEN